MIGWIALALLVALFAVLATGARRAWVRQRAADEESAWRAVASALEHAYSTADVPHELDRLPLPLLARIDDDVVAPELTGPSEGGIQRLFNASIDGVVATIGVADLARPVPSCSLRPKGAEGPPVGVGWDEIDPGLAHVRSRFEVRGEDATAIGELLGGELGGWLAGEGTDWSIEMAGNHVLLVRPEMPVDRFGEIADALATFRARLPWVIEAAAARQKREAARAAAGPESGPAGSGGAKRKRKRRKRKGSGGDQGGESPRGESPPSAEA